MLLVTGLQPGRHRAKKIGTGAFASLVRGAWSPKVYKLDVIACIRNILITNNITYHCITLHSITLHRITLHTYCADRDAVHAVHTVYAFVHT